jgi:hypothetical protein
MIYQFDNAWFDISSPDFDFELITTPDVISFSFNEEASALAMGSLTLNDNNHIYSRLLRNGMKLNISWGWNLGLMSMTKREGIVARINDPSGSAGQNGAVTFNCRFQTLDLRGTNEVQWFDAGTKEGVVKQTLTALDVAESYIDFALMKDAIGDATKVAKVESDFRFLVRLADEWRAVFIMGYSNKGQPVAVFCDADKVGKMAELGGGGASLRLSWGAGGSYSYADSINTLRQTSLYEGEEAPNVIEYSWRDRSMDAAHGQGTVTTQGADGQLQVNRIVVENETMKVWRLRPDRIYAEEQARETAEEREKLLMAYLSSQDFEEVKWAFEEIPETTAPQGSGYEVDCKLIGDPLITPGMTCGFGQGFPDRLGKQDSVWWVRSATHSISSSGYFTDIQIVDAYSFSPTGFKLPLAGSIVV